MDHDVVHEQVRRAVGGHADSYGDEKCVPGDVETDAQAADRERGEDDREQVVGLHEATGRLVVAVVPAHAEPVHDEPVHERGERLHEDQGEDGDPGEDERAH